MSESSKGFKVIDRRAFTTEGELREGVVIEDDNPVTSPTTAEPPAQNVAPAMTQQPATETPSTKSHGQAELPEPETDIQFMGFIQSLAQQSLMQLGLIPGPGGHPMTDIDRARDTIDILALIQYRSQDRLNDEEYEMFKGLLHELRMTYIEVTKRIAQSATEQPPQ